MKINLPTKVRNPNGSRKLAVLADLFFKKPVKEDSLEEVQL